jgi:toxin ParE1/3/4
MQVKWLRRALANLDLEAAYIAQDNPAAARALIDEAHEATQLLASHPDLGRPGRVPGTRELILRNFPYLIPYRVRDNNVEILRVFHASREWPAEFDR